MCILFPLLVPHMPQCVNCAGMLTTCPAHLMVVLTSTLCTPQCPLPLSVSSLLSPCSLPVSCVQVTPELSSQAGREAQTTRYFVGKLPKSLQKAKLYHSCIYRGVVHRCWVKTPEVDMSHRLSFLTTFLVGQHAFFSVACPPIVYSAPVVGTRTVVCFCMYRLKL